MVWGCDLKGSLPHTHHPYLQCQAYVATEVLNKAFSQHYGACSYPAVFTIRCTVFAGHSYNLLATDCCNTR